MSYPDAQTLHDWYWSEGMTLSDIADRLDRSTTAVWNRFEKLDIDRRPNIDWPDRETLYSWYVGERRSTRDIGNDLGCAASTVQAKLRELGVELRKPTDPSILWPDDEALLEWRDDEGLPLSEIGDRVGASAEAVRRRIDEARERPG